MPHSRDGRVPLDLNASCQLSVIDLCYDYYIDVFFILHGSSAPTYAQMQVGCALLSRLFPQWTGVLSFVDSCIYYDPDGSAHPLEVVHGGTLTLEVKDFHRCDLTSPAFGSSTELIVGPTDTSSPIPGADNSSNSSSSPPASYFARNSDSSALPATSLAKYTQLQDGCVIGLSIDHRCCDAHGASLFAYYLASLTRLAIEHEITTLQAVTASQIEHFRSTLSVSIPTPGTHAPPTPCDFDRNTLNAALSLDTLNASSSSSPCSYELPPPINHPFLRGVPQSNPLAIVAGTDLSNPGTFTFHFSPQDIQKIKQVSEQRAKRHGYASFISSHDAVAGFVYTLHLVATHLANRKYNIPEDASRQIQLCTAINCRTRFQISNSYSGNTALHSLAHGSVFADWINGVGAAVLIRRCIQEFDSDLAHSIAQWLYQASAGAKPEEIRQHFEAGWAHRPVQGFGDGCWTDWSRMYWKSSHFTPSGAANLEKYQIEIQSSSHPDLNPPMQVTPPATTLPGHLKMIDDLSGAPGSLLVQLSTGWAQAEQLGPGGPLHDALFDLEWIGQDFNYSPHLN